MISDRRHHALRPGDIRMTEQQCHDFRTATSCSQAHHAFRPAALRFPTSDIVLSDPCHHAFPATVMPRLSCTRSTTDKSKQTGTAFLHGGHHFERDKLAGRDTISTSLGMSVFANGFLEVEKILKGPPLPPSSDGGGGTRAFGWGRAG